MKTFVIYTIFVETYYLPLLEVCLIVDRKSTSLSERSILLLCKGLKL